MRWVIIRLIRGYQYLLSPWLGNHCRFYPSCSSYALTAVERYGALRGSRLALQRLLRCHPWSEGGIDEVPERECGHSHG
ncbi:MAG: membrane protein insertion efficiency factor YidD [Gammaproteobacteria bacterium]|mgnify:FL=1|nr:membrane protein insertion efficiency factor YidD [Gammaproteobacteria bacterium]